MQLKKILPLILILISCSSTKKVVDEPHLIQRSSAPLEYNNALKNIEEGKYTEARQDLQSFLSKNPVSSYTQVANFNIAYTLEMEHAFTKAADQYREVAVSTSKSAPRLQAYALYRLSYCFEAVGDDQQVVAVLTDLRSRSDELQAEIASAEIPARLAAAYSRIGNIELAQQYYTQAEKAMVKYRRQLDQKDRPTWLAKTLYHMGRVNLREVTWENFEIIVRPLPKAQQFLLEASELSDAVWSKKAEEELANLYKSLWQVIRTPRAVTDKDEVLQQRAYQQRQWEMTFQLVDLLDDLKRHRLNNQNSSYVDQVFNETEKISKEIRKMLNQQKIGSDLTPAARKRILGQRPLSKLPQKNKNHSLAEPVIPPPVATPDKDPNL